MEKESVIGTDNLVFHESIFSPYDLPGKVPIRDKNGLTIDDIKRESAIESAMQDMDSHADMVDGMGRNLLEVLGVSTIPEAMAEIRRRCNNNGEIDNTGIPDFKGIRIGDYIDGLDLSSIGAVPGGTAPQIWDDTYKNNRIEISGFNIYKGGGDTENTKNHILFTFRNVVCTGPMNATNTNIGGYIATAMRTWLEGANGDGSGSFAAGLKAALGGEYLYTIRKYHAAKTDATASTSAWNSYTVWLPSEIEVFGYQARGDEIASADGSRAVFGVQFPIYQRSMVHRIKRRNGSRAWWWEMTGSASNTLNFCGANNNGYANYHIASSTDGGVAPAFCVA
jgi:hypothetical protein